MRDEVEGHATRLQSILDMAKDDFKIIPHVKMPELTIDRPSKAADIDKEAAKQAREIIARYSRGPLRSLLSRHVTKKGVLQLEEERSENACADNLTADVKETACEAAIRDGKPLSVVAAILSYRLDLKPDLISAVLKAASEVKVDLLLLLLRSQDLRMILPSFGRRLDDVLNKLLERRTLARDLTPPESSVIKALYAVGAYTYAASMEFAIRKGDLAFVEMAAQSRYRANKARRTDSHDWAALTESIELSNHEILLVLMAYEQHASNSVRLLELAIDKKDLRSAVIILTRGLPSDKYCTYLLRQVLSENLGHDFDWLKVFFTAGADRGIPELREPLENAVRIRDMRTISLFVKWGVPLLHVTLDYAITRGNTMIVWECVRERETMFNHGGQWRRTSDRVYSSDDERYATVPTFLAWRNQLHDLLFDAAATGSDVDETLVQAVEKILMAKTVDAIEPSEHSLVFLKTLVAGGANREYKNGQALTSAFRAADVQVLTILLESPLSVRSASDLFKKLYEIHGHSHPSVRLELARSIYSPEVENLALDEILFEAVTQGGDTEYDLIAFLLDVSARPEHGEARTMYAALDNRSSPRVVALLSSHLRRENWDMRKLLRTYLTNIDMADALLSSGHFQGIINDALVEECSNKSPVRYEIVRVLLKHGARLAYTESAEFKSLSTSYLHGAFTHYKDGVDFSTFLSPG